MTQLLRRSRCILTFAALFILADTGAHAATLVRVGPGGQFTTLAAALAHALSHPDEDLELALRSGTYSESVEYQMPRSGDLTISGGWSADWTARDGGPAATVVKPSLFDWFATSETTTTLRIENLTFAEGAAPLKIFCTSGGSVELKSLVVRDFASVAPEGSVLSGGALSLRAALGCIANVVEDSEFRNNRIDLVGAADAGYGAGMFYLADQVPLRVTRSTFSGNTVNNGQQAEGIALYAQVLGEAALELSDVRITNNHGVPNDRSAILLAASTGGTVTADRLVVDGNGGEFSGQLYVIASRIALRNSVIARSSGRGAVVQSLISGDLSSLTIVDNAWEGILLAGENETLANSIAVGNTTNIELDGAPTLIANLTSGDPKFVAREAGDYRLLPDSPAIDAGNASPPGGLGDFDVRGAARVAGAKPDQGAYEVGPSGCRGDDGTLCLTNGRFAVDAAWRVPDGKRGLGTAVPLTGDTGQFWFFDASNVELMVKLLDGCGLNQRFWVFAGGLTNVEVTLTVEDTATGKINRYVNPLNTAYVSLQETSAFASCGEAYDASGAVVVPPPSPYVPSASAGCTPTATTLCLTGSRFQVRATWHAPDGTSGTAGVVPLSADTGALWFFGSSNVEMLVKLLNGCGLNAKYWAFFTGLTNVEVDLEIVDTQTGTVYPYHNPPGRAFPPVQDTSAFGNCPAL